jgi:signal transduction histidine kinase/CheY-like chemotaxis protein/HPt (histidine-containing phosphotransfer) domain-containing protein
LLTVDHAEEQERARQLLAALYERAAAAQESATLRQEEGFEAPLAPDQRTRSREATQQVAVLVERMEQEESGLLAARQVFDLQRQRRQLVVITAAFGTLATILLLSCGAIFLESARRRRSEQQMKEIVENLPVTVWQMITGNGRPIRFAFVGGNADRDRGFTGEQLLRDPDLVLKTVAPEDRAQVSAAFEAAELGLQPLECSYRIEPSPGSVRWMHNRAGLRRRPDGSVLWTGYWADITPQKEMEHALREATATAEQANRAKSTFLATMSHEIRTPLYGVMGLLELLSLTTLDGDQRATLGVVRESGRSLLRIIDDILDFSKVEAGRLTLEPVPASLRATIARACQVHSGVASSRGLLLEHRIDESLAAALLFDPLRLGQILSNFISNAIKFTPQGSVRVVAELVQREADAERIRITVTDTGIGIAPEYVDRLFQPFVQAQQASSSYGGTGLGLTISRRLAELMGATVQMQSTPGTGTCMTFEGSFPIADPAAVVDLGSEGLERRLTHTVSGRRMAPTAAVAEREGTLVLVVDDHPTNRLVLSRQVTALGYGVMTAEDGEEGLAVCKVRRVALVLTDCNMPRLSGYEFARAVREMETESGAKHLPIIGCTANAMSTEAARCIAAGMDDCMVKPVDLTELMERLDLWVPLPQAETVSLLALPAAAAGDEPFDLALLEMITGGDPAVERELLEDFLNSNAADMAALQQATRAGDKQEVRRLLHRISGAAQTLGAGEFLAACGDLATALGHGQGLRELQALLATAADLEDNLRSRLRAGSATA